ncbi:DUF2474 family protein [Aureimonas glaciei]|uniref:DUF2474 domain-containing protein n=1 Tax=Aureimonas glaciei TaxID=1776957 RepID=A0A916XT34_9HYPH|nr:DUF2474 family protein [Aureimonas glaciei]GGD06949.1 hypothetical protein GCM10011335_07440 [Aureimonas glaciei]
MRAITISPRPDQLSDAGTRPSRLSPRARQILWFAGLWLGSILALGTVSLVIRSVLL